MLPYDGMTRTGSKGVSHCAGFDSVQTPSEGRKVLEIWGNGKYALSASGVVVYVHMLCCARCNFGSAPLQSVPAVDTRLIRQIPNMQKFSDILPTLAPADGVQRISLSHADGRNAGVIENKPGSQGSIRVYHHLQQKWGTLGSEAAQEGLAIYAEHTEDAKLNPGKHPNIDRLFEIIKSQQALNIKIER